jgi:hypothetical protein
MRTSRNRGYRRSSDRLSARPLQTETESCQFADRKADWGEDHPENFSDLPYWLAISFREILRLNL